MDFSNINFLAVLVAAIAAFILGFVWHGPLFGKMWMKLVGVSQADMQAMQAKGMGPMVPHMIAALVQLFVTAFVVAHLADALILTGAMEAIFFGFLVWLGFIATTLLNDVLWQKGKMDLYLFKIVYQLINLVMISLIVVLWQ